MVSLRERKDYAARLQEIDTHVKRIIAALQAKGFKSPYLRNYVVARINPSGSTRRKKATRSRRCRSPRRSRAWAAAARTFKTESVSSSDLAWVAVGAGSSE